MVENVENVENVEIEASEAFIGSFVFNINVLQITTFYQYVVEYVKVSL